jgi:hypothetical protein
MTEYGCGYNTLMDAIFDKINIDDWRKIRRQQYKRSAASSWVTRKANRKYDLEKKNKPDIRCTNCGWKGFNYLDTPRGGLLKVYKGDKECVGRKRDDPNDEGWWVCPQCYTPEDEGITDIHDDDEDNDRS